MAKVKKPRSRAKTTGPFSVNKNCYIIQFVGGELDGRTNQMPIPRPENRTNPVFLNKSWFKALTTQKNCTYGNGKQTLFEEYCNYYVPEQVCRPKKHQVIRYIYAPTFAAKTISAYL